MTKLMDRSVVLRMSRDAFARILQEKRRSPRSAPSASSAVKQSPEPLTRRERMPRQKFLRAHPATAFALQLQNSQGAAATAHDDAAFVGRQNFSRRAAALRDFRLQNFQESARRRAEL